LVPEGKRGGTDGPRPVKKREYDPKKKKASATANEKKEIG